MADPHRPAAQVADRMAAAAAGWLAGLASEQVATAQGSAPSPDARADAERRRWFYTPTDHGGLTLHEQRPAQQRRAMALVATGLSEAGFVTVSTAMGLENVLDRSEGFTALFDRERGRDPGSYHLRVFGEPGGSQPWGWRFGGHHVSLSNLVVDGELVATTPSFIGADPASAPLLGARLRPLGPTEDLARELVRSLPADLAEAAVLLPRAPSDVVGGNRAVLADGDEVLPMKAIWRGPFRDAQRWAGLVAASDAMDAAAGLSAQDRRRIAYTEQPKGLPASALDAGQRELLRSVLATYLGRVPDEVSPMARYLDEAALDAVHLAWAGPTEEGAPHYYRLQGPRLLIEWDNTQRAANHAHAAWRDPGADFGLDALAAHRSAHH